MKILVFDTETGGLNPFENDILQLSYQIVDLEKKDVVKSVDRFFPWPDDKSRVCWGAIKVNGLTEEYLATKELSDRFSAMVEFYIDMEDCEVLVAHNGDFDKKFITATAQREGMSHAGRWKPIIDTMKTTTNLCKIPSSRGCGYKWPKLIELANHLNVKTDDINLHDSSADVELTKRCFIHLLEKEFYKL